MTAIDEKKYLTENAERVINGGDKLFPVVCLEILEEYCSRKIYVRVASRETGECYDTTYIYSKGETFEEVNAAPHEWNAFLKETVRSAIEKHCIRFRYDGLAGDDCGCFVDDLFPCGEVNADCVFGLVRTDENGDKIITADYATSDVARQGLV